MKSRGRYEFAGVLELASKVFVEWSSVSVGLPRPHDVAARFDFETNESIAGSIGLLSGLNYPARRYSAAAIATAHNDSRSLRPERTYVDGAFFS